MGYSLQAQKALQERYPFLHTEVNHIQIPGEDGNAQRLFDKLDRLAFEGQGEVNILHIGGSHVQAGTLSSAMRKGLQELSPGLKGQRGFFFPFRLAGSNEPANFSVQANGEWEGFRCSVRRHEALWGVSGITAETYERSASAHVDAYDETEGRYAFRRIRIFHPIGPRYYRPIVTDSLLPLDTVFYDPRGFTEFRFDSLQQHFHFGLHADSGAEKFVWQGIQYLEDGPGLSYHAIGVNGASTESYLRCEMFPSQLKALAPDLVIFGIGINDAYKPLGSFDKEAFGRRYDSLMDYFEAANPEVVFLFMSNNDSYYRRRVPNTNAFEVSEVMQRLATERNGLYWDLFNIMGGLGSIDMWVDAGLARRDRIHFTGDGYRLQAALFAKAFEEMWQQMLEAKNRAE